MEREFRCPSCGAENAVTNPGILMKVCDYCKTALYWDKESALRAGNKSLDLPQSPRFKVGAYGKLAGKPFAVLGRLTYEHDSGFWHEWFIEQEDGSLLWLTEDEGELFIERPLTLKNLPPSFDSIKAGSEITLDDKTAVVEEIGYAKCIGGEGQIPFLVELGDTYPYVDGASMDGANSFGLEYDSQGAPKAFWGRIVNLKSAAPKSLARSEAEAKQSELIQCVNCGKPWEGKRVDNTKMVVCAACGAALELDGAETRVVGLNTGDAPIFTFGVGVKLEFDGVVYGVMGRMVYVAQDEGLEYSSREYILYNPAAGYKRLSEESGHFVLSEVTHTHFRYPESAGRKTRVQIGGEKFQLFETGIAILRWVDGALPWRAVTGESTQYTLFIHPPHCVDYEITGNEVELFRGTYVTNGQMQSAAPPDWAIPTPLGIHPCQPYVAAPWLRNLWKIGAIFLALNVLLLIYAAAGVEKQVLSDTVTAEQYKAGYTSVPFTVAKNGEVLRVVGKAPVNNSWLGVDVGLVTPDDKVVNEVNHDLYFYHGADEDGTWNEGSSVFSSHMRVAKAGDYKLLVRGEGGSGVQGTGPARQESVTITLFRNSRMPGYFWGSILACAFFLLLEPLLRWRFNRKRWRE